MTRLPATPPAPIGLEPRPVPPPVGLAPDGASPPPPAAAPGPGPAVSQDAPLRTPWTWAIVACLLLGGAVGVRAWQHSRFAREEERGIALPFPLKDLPSVVGRDGRTWRAEEGIDQSLDTQTIRYAGGLDSLTRTYIDEHTGVRLMVLVLYGRADRVVEHIPELCYNGAGFERDSMAPADRDRAIDFAAPDGQVHQAVFRSGVYAKRLGPQILTREQAYHAFRHEGRWSPSSPLTGYNRRPIGVFKIQVQRRLGAAEDPGRDDRGPIDQFLHEFLGEFERTLAAAESPAAPTAE